MAVGLQLALLGYFKYAGFILENVKRITGVPEVIPEIVLPIGISFYTFQLISYVVDVYREEVAPQKKYWLVLLYCSLFHQCIAGPIVRYKDVAREIEHRRPKIPEIGRGVNRFTIGLVKKRYLQIPVRRLRIHYFRRRSYLLILCRPWDCGLAL